SPWCCRRTQCAVRSALRACASSALPDGSVALTVTAHSNEACVSCCAGCTAAHSMWARPTSRRIRRPCRSAPRCWSCAKGCGVPFRASSSNSRLLCETRSRCWSDVRYPGAGVMLDLSLLPDGGMNWLDASGESSNVVLSTRLRLARNVEGYAFAPRAREGERLRVLAQVKEVLPQIPSLASAVVIRVDELPIGDRLLLHERHLVSKELAGLEDSQTVRPGAAVILSPGASVMVNEEDHLRLQTLQSGCDVRAAHASISRLDRELGGRIPYSFHSEFGYLTACPTNVGTGLRASVLIHLPGLVLTKEIGRV